MVNNVVKKPKEKSEAGRSYRIVINKYDFFFLDLNLLIKR